MFLILSIFFMTTLILLVALEHNHIKKTIIRMIKEAEPSDMYIVRDLDTGEMEYAPFNKLTERVKVMAHRTAENGWEIHIYG